MLLVNDLMTVIPSAVSPNTPLRTIVGIMKSEGCRQLPILERGKLVGMITDRDVRLAMNSPMVDHGHWQDEEILGTVTAETCMTPKPITVSPGTPAYEAARMLATYKFGSLPVVEDGALVGIITVTDYLNYVAKMLEDET